ncbi:MAG: hypothetical protein IJ180_05365 [Bacteroidales bacterium]|nr:hypothetical protein [Bacteroidales bacterium]
MLSLISQFELDKFCYYCIGARLCYKSKFFTSNYFALPNNRTSVNCSIWNNNSNQYAD